MDKKILKTRSGIEVKEIYGEESAGSYPYTRGIQKDMYRGRLWTMRQYAGFGSAEESNKRYRYLLSQGTMGLSVAFDLPTQLGLDPDHERSQGEVGKVGVSIANLEDMEALFHQIDLSKVSTSVTINATANILFALYVAVAERHGVPIKDLRGTVQNDVLKEYVARGNYIYPPEGTLRLATDLFEWSSQNTPKWNPISISGYHIREAGSNAIQELAFTFANAMAYIDAALKKGLKIDTFAGQLSFFFNVHNDFFEEIAKFRAARKIWAKITKELYGAKDPRSWMLRFHSQTAGSTLTAQQPMNNIVRVSLQALASVLGGTQSLHTNSMDEALSLPTEAAATVALRTQQVIAHESNVTQTVDPLGGSVFIESLTSEIEKKTWEYLEEIKTRGGTIACIESGYIQNEILNSAYEDQKKIEREELKVVGVNCFQTDKSPKEKIEILKVSQEIEKQAIQKIKAFRANRTEGKTKAALEALKQGAKGTANLQALILNAVEAQATLGEISDVLREVFGVHRDFSGF